MDLSAYWPIPLHFILFLLSFFKGTILKNIGCLLKTLDASYNFDNIKFLDKDKPNGYRFIFPCQRIVSEKQKCYNTVSEREGFVVVLFCSYFFTDKKPQPKE